MARSTIRRPLGVSIIAVLLLIGSVISLGFALSILMRPGPQTVGDAAFFGLFGVFGLALAAGNWGLSRWAWYATVIWEGLNVALYAVVFPLFVLALLSGAGAHVITNLPGLLTGMAVTLGILTYLLQPRIRQAYQLVASK